jgi:4-hydroxy 2-oxovalerate aldolase
MKILDCTLRDGGFVNNFNWNIEFAKRYYQLMCGYNIPFIELGYWGQTAKSKNRFYNLNEDDVLEITGPKNKKNAVVIIDYHYCNKDVSSYPKKLATPVTMIRITSRKEDIDQALKFSEKLHNKTNIDVSFQIINCTNYSKKELEETVSKILKYKFMYIYFADSHGNLNLTIDYDKYKDSIDKIKYQGIGVGFHLHNHTGRALTNFYTCKNNNIDITDTSILGLGKGGGNLKLEDIIINEYFIRLLEFIEFESKHFNFNNKIYLYNLITGRLGVTDNYAKSAFQDNLSLSRFYEICSLLRDEKKDTFQKSNLIK